MYLHGSERTDIFAMKYWIIAIHIIPSVLLGLKLFVINKQQPTCECLKQFCVQCTYRRARKYIPQYAFFIKWRRESTCDERWASLAPNKNDSKRKSFGTLILIRHGQSAWNRKPAEPDVPWRYAGSIDVPLR